MIYHFTAHQTPFYVPEHKGAFFEYVDTILAFFDHLSTGLSGVDICEGIPLLLL